MANLRICEYANMRICEYAKGYTVNEQPRIRVAYSHIRLSAGDNFAQSISQYSI